MKAKKENIKFKKSDTIWGYLFILAPVLSVLLFVFLPAILSVHVSTIEWNGFVSIGQATPVGFDNFAKFLSSGGIFTSRFWNALLVTISLLLFVPFNIIIAFLLAYALNAKTTKLKRTLRLAYFLPFVSSSVAITLVFKNLFEVNGVVNSFLSIFGVTDINWLRSPALARVVIIVMLVWRNIGYTMLMYLAGLQGISEEQYEAARLDGAGVLQTITKITLPSLTNITFFLVVTNVISGLQIFTEPAILFQSTSGRGPMNGTESLMVFLMQAFQNNDLGMASAISWVITILVLLATFIQFVVKKEE